MGKYAWELKENTAISKDNPKNTCLKKQPNNFLMNRDEDQTLRTKNAEKRLHSDYPKAAGNRKLRNS